MDALFRPELNFSQGVKIGRSCLPVVGHVPISRLTGHVTTGVREEALCGAACTICLLPCIAQDSPPMSGVPAAQVVGSFLKVQLTLTPAQYCLFRVRVFLRAPNQNWRQALGGLT